MSDSTSGHTALAQRLLDALPHTQCTRCGYPDCAAYAQALAEGSAAINQCPPGGEEGIRRLAALTGQAALPLNPTHGVEAPRTVAVIDEAWCIGCTLCLPACPTDAIFGANKMMHTVIEHYCTGCELCLPVCPVDCIQMQPVSKEHSGWAAWSQQQADQARERYAQHQQRLQRQEQERAQALEAKALTKLADLPAHTHNAQGDELARKRLVIEAALLRARAQHGSGSG